MAQSMESSDELLQQFRLDAERLYPGRLKRAILFGSRARGDAREDSDWDVALFIENFDRSRESRPLNFLCAGYRLRGLKVSAIGLPVDRHGVDFGLLRNIDYDGVSL
jgi:hypothetical protein